MKMSKNGAIEVKLFILWFPNDFMYHAGTHQDPMQAKSSRCSPSKICPEYLSVGRMYENKVCETMK